MRTIRSLVAVVSLVTLSGCAAMRDNYPLCVAVFTGTGAALGGAAGGAITSEVVNHGDCCGSKNWEIAGGTAAGVAAGGLVGWALSNAFCEEEVAPPPPPPPPARTPPPPPPPATERRGG